jgi:hypothetical protein
MAKKPAKEKRERKPPGPPADTLALEGPWEAAVAHALKRGRPAEPEPELPTATCPKCGAAVQATEMPKKDKDGRHATASFVCPNKHAFTQRVHLHS